MEKGQDVQKLKYANNINFMKNGSEGDGKKEGGMAKKKGRWQRQRRVSIRIKFISITYTIYLPEPQKSPHIHTLFTFPNIKLLKLFRHQDHFLYVENIPR